MKTIIVVLSVLWLAVLSCCAKQQEESNLTDVEAIAKAKISYTGFRLDGDIKAVIENYLIKNATDYPSRVMDDRGIVIKRIEYEGKVRYLVYHFEKKALRMFGARNPCEPVDLEALFEIGTDFYFSDVEADTWICPSEIMIAGYVPLIKERVETGEWQKEDTSAFINRSAWSW